ncbi:LytTR family DNA-binding domain-containing protein [Eisenbergiella porci]|uniref:LytTR family DNA-binding domain-containing protein n=1 Tax=Eisenbergiella porci TaxID=2652274 RepID=UPI002A803191|nr:LytTR family DNA-binding domain-containing protein [Eisenbergiella porci]
MRVTVERIGREKEEQVLIQCYEVTESIREIERFVKLRQEKLEGYDADRMYCIPLSDVYYAEAVDNRLYIYTEKNVYELKMKLYAFEENYCSGEFFRCSRTAVVNLMRVSYLRPGLNGRLSARLTNGEDIIISRKYVNALKARLQNE